jgi:hypothetical protein
MKAMQPSGAQAAVDRRGPQAHRQELRPRHDASLAVRDRGDRTVRREFASHNDA